MQKDADFLPTERIARRITGPVPIPMKKPEPSVQEQRPFVIPLLTRSGLLIAIIHLQSPFRLGLFGKTADATLMSTHISDHDPSAPAG